MGSELFASGLADHRAVEIPAELDAAARTRFVTLIRTAVEKQAALAKQHPKILRVDPQIEADKHRVVIRHEPASPADAAAIVAAAPQADLTTLWWVTASLVPALAAGHEQMLVHGGIHNGVLFLDRSGCLKVGDFGIAPVYEVVCGGRERRRVACIIEPGGGAERGASSGRWALLTEDSRRPYGWIAPYFSHELLESEDLRLNPKSDQFALGTLLFLWATGTHPYGAALDDPSLNFYFHFEPFALEEERPEWADVFKKQRSGLTSATDRPLCAWADLVRRLLSSEPAERFANIKEAGETITEHVSDSWGRAVQAISAALVDLDAGQPEAFLTQVEPCAADDSLPAPWATRLAALVADVQAQKDVIIRRKELAALLHQAEETFASGDLEQTRRLAEEAAADPAADDGLRDRSAELLSACQEREEIIEQAVRAQADEVFNAARQALGTQDFNDARLCLNALVQDEATPEAIIQEARQFLDEIDRIEQDHRRRSAELDQVRRDLSGGELDAAEQRLSALRGEEGLSDEMAAAAGQLADEIASQRERLAASRAALDAAELAWEAADPAAMQEALAGVSADLCVTEIVERHQDLADRADALAATIAQRDTAERVLAEGNAAAAAAVLARALENATLPASLRQELTEAAEHTQEVLREQQQQAADNARDSLAQAESAFVAGDEGAARAIIEGVVLGAPHLPDELRKTAEKLQARCDRFRAATATLGEIADKLGQDELDAAAASLEQVDTAGLPETIETQAADLRQQLAEARRLFAERQRERLAGQIEDAGRRLATGDVSVEPVLREVAGSPHCDAELTNRVAALRAELEQAKAVTSTLAAAEAALARDDIQAAQTLLAKGGKVEGERLAALPAELPGWAIKRATQLRKRIAEAEAERRRKVLAAWRADLEAAEAALNAGDHAKAKPLLARTGSDLELDEALHARQEKLQALAAALAKCMPQIEALEQRLLQDDVHAVGREAQALLADTSLPAPAGARLRRLIKDATTRTVTRRQQIDIELRDLTAELDRHGRRARDVPRRAEAIRADALATDEQRKAAAELVARFEAMPKPRPVLPLVGVAAVVLLALGGGAWFLMGSGGGNGGGGDGGGNSGGGNSGAVVTPVTPTQPQPEPGPEPVVETLPTALERANEHPPTLPALPPLADLVAADSAPLADLLRLVLTEQETAVAFRSDAPIEWSEDPADASVVIADVLADTVAGPLTLVVTARCPEEGDTPTECNAILPADELGKIADWLASEGSGLTAVWERISDEQRQQVRGLVETLDAQRWFADAHVTLPQPVVEPVVEPVVAQTPPADLTLTLLQAAQTSSPPLAEVLQTLPAARDAALSLDVANWAAAADEPTRYTQTVDLAALADGLTAGVYAQNTAAAGEPATWSVGLTDEAVAALAGWARGRVEHVLRELGNEGELATAWDRHDAVATQLATLGQTLNTDMLPPAWATARADLGLAETWADGPLDPRLGYPESLKNAETQAELLLVRAYPTSEIWQQFSGQTPRWWIFYVDARPAGQPAETFADARAAAREQFGRGLPTHDEWTLAALMLGGDAATGLLGGRYEWSTGDEGGPAWACGGRPEDTGDRSPIPAPPRPQASVAERQAWLANPLVSQRRAYGDGLVTYRTVLRVYESR
ncbi:MAG: hypothetical protein PVJ57_09000 [Phycisphaerae bacterium]